MRFLGYIQGPSKLWPPITRLTQLSLAYLFPSFLLTKHKYKTRTSSHIFLFAPLELNLSHEQLYVGEHNAFKLGLLLAFLPQ
jgi:hypothetical protein